MARNIYTDLGVKPYGENEFPSAPRKGVNAIAADTVQGARNALPRAWDIVKSLPGEIGGAAPQLLGAISPAASVAFGYDPTRGGRNVAAGIGNALQGVANIPSNIENYAANIGYGKGNQLPHFDADFNKMAGLGEQQPGDAFIQGLVGLLPYAKLGGVGRGGKYLRPAKVGAAFGLQAIGENENPITAALQPAIFEGAGRLAHGAGHGAGRLAGAALFPTGSSNGLKRVIAQHIADKYGKGVTTENLLKNVRAAGGTNTNLGRVLGNPELAKKYEQTYPSRALGPGTEGLVNTSNQIYNRTGELAEHFGKGIEHVGDAQEATKKLIEDSYTQAIKVKNALYDEVGEEARKEGFKATLPRTLALAASEVREDLNGLHAYNPRLATAIKGALKILDFAEDFKQKNPWHIEDESGKQLSKIPAVSRDEALRHSMDDFEREMAGVERVESKKKRFKVRQPPEVQVELKDLQTMSALLSEQADELIFSQDIAGRDLGRRLKKMSNVMRRDMYQSVRERASPRIKELWGVANRNYRDTIPAWVRHRKLANPNRSGEKVLSEILGSPKLDQSERLKHIAKFLGPKNAQVLPYLFIESARNKDGVITPQALYKKITTGIGKRQFEALFDKQMQRELLDFQKLMIMNKEILDVQRIPKTGFSALADISAARSAGPGAAIGGVLGGPIGATIGGSAMVFAHAIEAKAMSKILEAPNFRADVVQRILKERKNPSGLLNKKSEGLLDALLNMTKAPNGDNNA